MSGEATSKKLRASAGSGSSNTQQACSVCRQKHKKCDGAVPCGYCRLIQQPEKCSYTLGRRRGPKPMESIYDYCNRLKQELEVQHQIAEHWKEQFLSVVQDGAPVEDIIDQKFEVENSSSSISTSSTPALPRFSAAMPTVEPEEYEFDWESLLKYVDSNPVQEQVELAQNTPVEFSVELAVQICRASLWDVSSHLPEMNLDPPSPTLLLDLWKLTPIELKALVVTNTGRAAQMLSQAVIGVVGSAISGYQQHAYMLLSKAEYITNLFFTNIEILQARGDLTKRIATALLFLWLYFLNDDRYEDRTNLIFLVYDLASRHREHIPAALMMQVHLARLCISETLEDAQFWYYQAMSIETCTTGQTPSIVIQALADSMFGIRLLHPKLIFNAAPTPTGVSVGDLIASEQRLSSLEHLISRGFVIMSEYPYLAKHLQDVTQTVRTLAIAIRAGTNALLGNAEYATRLIEAVYLSIHFLHPNLQLYIYAVYCAIEAAMMVQSVHLVRQLYQVLSRVSHVFPGMVRIRTRTVEFLQSHDPLSPLPLPAMVTEELSEPEKLALAQKIAVLAAPLHESPISSWSEEKLRHELSRAEAVVQRFGASSHQVVASLENEIKQLERDGKLLPQSIEQQPVISGFMTPPPQTNAPPTQEPLEPLDPLFPQL